MKKNLILIIALTIIFLAGCNLIAKPAETNKNLPPTTKDSGQDCGADQDCQSGVCNFIKENWGQCAAAVCETGSQTIAVSGDTSFYCDEQKKWQPIKQFGEACQNDYECLKITCKDSPSCHPGDFKYYCKDGECVAEQQPDPCEEQGLKRITQKDEYIDLEQCTESIAQREIQTVCAPCGNGKCETDLENKCNCPTDCQYIDESAVKNIINNISYDQKICNIDQDCELFTSECCPIPRPCGNMPQIAVNKDSNTEISQKIARYCPSAKCPFWSLSPCSCQIIEEFSPVCINNQCQIKKDVDCQNYCKALELYNNNKEVYQNRKSCVENLELPLISDQKLLTPENTKKCGCSNKILTDQNLIDYAQSDFDKEKMMFKDIILGTHNGIPVKVSFPCSDVCPQYTTRIIRYDLELDKCEQAGGVVKELTVPFAIGVKQEKFCLPQVIADLKN